MLVAQTAGPFMKKPISLTQAYIIAFLLLAMWALFAYLTMLNQIQAQEQYAALINVSGKQRMLSQRTALLANHFLDSRDPAFLDELKEHRLLMLDDHEFLVSHIPSDEIHAIYYDKPYRLEDKTRAYFQLLERFIAKPDTFTTIQIYLKTSSLLPVLDHAVNVYEQESRDRTALLMRLEGYILLGSLLTLLFEAFFIIRPALKRATLTHNELAQMVEDQTERLTIYKQIFANSNDGILITDADNVVIDVNSSFSRIAGFSAEEVKGKKPDILKSSHMDSSFYDHFWRDLLDDEHWSGEFINRKKDGSIYHQRTYVFLLKDGKGEVKYHIGIMSDVSEMKEDQNRLENLALYDVLTHLPNRALFYSQVQKAIERSRRYQHKLALILFDLDNFKSINDTLSHRIGDHVLQNIGTLLTNCTRNLDTVARFGGDEFVMLIEEIQNENNLVPILEKIQKLLAEPMNIESYQLHITCSMGVAIFPDDADNYETLLQYADTAMYHAKKHGKNQFSFFTAQLNDAVQQRLRIERELVNALGNKEFRLRFQPVFNLHERRIIGFEVLISWYNPTLGIVPPEEFISVSESLGTIHAIDRWVLESVRDLLAAGKFNGLSLSVNISPKCFGRPDFIADIEEIFSASEVCHQVIFELTEEGIAKDVSYAKETLEELARAGFKIVIDDFGKGNSSLDQLVSLPVTALKIDKGFVSSVEQSEQGRVATNSIVAVAEKMKVMPIAEGIETAEQLDFLLTESHCSYGQGYYLAHPLELEEALLLLEPKAGE